MNEKENIFEIAKTIVGANLLLKMLNNKEVSQEEIQTSREIIKALDKLKRLKKLEEGSAKTKGFLESPHKFGDVEK